MLGLGPYTPVRVLVPWNRNAETSEAEDHHQEALRRALQPDELWLVGTVDAQQKYAAKVPHARFLTIPKGVDESEFWSMFEVVVSGLRSLPAGEAPHEVHLDLTHGFRTQPMFLLTAVRYVCRLWSDRLALAGVYYNCFEPRRSSPGQGPIMAPDPGAARHDGLDTPTASLLAVDPLLDLEQVAAEIQSLLGHAVASPLAARLESVARSRIDVIRRAHEPELSSLAPPARNARLGELRRDDPALGLLTRFAKDLRTLGAVVGLNFTPAAAEVIRDLCRHSEEARVAFTGDLRPIGDALVAMTGELQSLLPADSAPLWPWHVALARWCLARGLDQQALTHAEELMVTRACEEAGRSPLDLDARGAVGRPLKGLCNREKEEYAALPDCWRAILDPWRTVTVRRNQVNHAFMRREGNEDPISTHRKVREAVESLLVAIEKLPRFPDPPRDLGTGLESPPGSGGMEGCDPEAPTDGGTERCTPGPAPPTPRGFPPRPSPRSAAEILAELGRLVGRWGTEKEAKLSSLASELRTHHPESVAELDRLLAIHGRITDLLDRAYRAGSVGRGAPSPSDLVREARELDIDGLEGLVGEKFRKGSSARARREKERAASRRGGPLSTVQPRPSHARPTSTGVGPALARSAPPAPEGLHPNDLRALEPSPRWTFLLDETGHDFGESHSGQAGRFVGLLVPEGAGLAALPRAWHAVTVEDPAEIDGVVQSILDGPVGVVGLTLQALPATPGERWLDGMRALVDWALRMIPLDGPTHIEVLIEARPPFKPKHDQVLLQRDALALLARSWPDRARDITLEVRTITKDEHPLNGYVDAVAFTWGSPAAASKERRRRSGLIGTCLIDMPARELQDCWDAWDQPGGLAPTAWSALIRGSDAANRASVVWAILSALKHTCRDDPRRWQGYLDEARRHLYDGAVNLHTLGNMVDWLEEARPRVAQLPGTLRLVWLTTRLARANHLGEVEHQWLAELQSLSATLLDEAAPLCAEADLHLAVTATNRFDFSGATASLRRWLEQPVAAPGLLRWGQLCSSLGQHLAFNGDHTEALELFAHALDAFDRLSDPELRRSNRSQTSCYAAIAAMDLEAGRVPAAHSRGSLESFLGASIAASITRLGPSASDGDRYPHHTLLRWLVTHGTVEERNRYLDTHAHWSTGEGHPWPLIVAYRALLLRSRAPEEAVDLLVDAAGLAFVADQGPTVRSIGAAIRASAVTWGARWPESEAVLRELRVALPSAAARLDRIAAFVAEPGDDPLALLVEVLPFNFR
jgi:CRISPR-associated DxTHG motif protein